MRSLILVLYVVLVAALAARADDLGRRVYSERCSACHGDGGGGDGPAAAALVPRPRNFHDAAFWRERKPEDLKTIVKHGKPGTMMPGFEGVLSDAEIDAALTRVRRFAPVP